MRASPVRCRGSQNSRQECRGTNKTTDFHPIEIEARERVKE
jgi:hypothetical protein